MFTDKHIKSLKPRTAPFRVSEDTNRRGVGRLIVEVKPTGNRYLFYKYFQKLNGKSNKTLISLGRYKSSPRASGISLADARTKVLEFENLQRNGKDPKAYLVAKKLDEQEESRKIVQKKSHGTFDDLLNAYLEKMESDGKRSVQQVRRSLKTYVRDPFPELLPVRAKKIDTDDIRRIISRMIANKITTHSNRVRSYLHAAFQSGLKADNDPERHAAEEAQVFFHLSTNPVSAIGRKDKYEVRGKHVIDENELRIVWNELPNKDLFAGQVVRLAICTGQRLGELARLKWTDIDTDAHALTIPETVSKNKVEHTIPLPELAWTVIQEMRDITGDCEYIFSARSNHKLVKGNHLHVNTIAKMIRALCNENGELQKFIGRDIRRSWKTHTGRIGINKTIRDVCQNHAQKIDVSSRHYDMCAYMPEKKQAMETWDSYLATILNPSEKIIHIKRA